MATLLNAWLDLALGPPVGEYHGAVLRETSMDYNSPNPQVVTHELFHESSGEWTLPEFIVLLTALLDQVPEACRDSARVELEDNGYHESNVSLVVRYEGPESPEQVARRVKFVRQSAAEEAARDRREFDRLKAKFKD